MNPVSDQTIALTAIGVEKPILMTHLAERIEQVFGYRVEPCNLLSDVAFAYDENREQYHSTAILEHLEKLASERSIKVLAVTDVDLFIPILTHVYGEAQLGGRTAVVSLYRLRQGLNSVNSERLLFTRAAKEAIHELGHTFQLRHCPDASCIMHYCRTEKDVDDKSEQLCRYCSIMVEDERRRLSAPGGV